MNSVNRNARKSFKTLAAIDVELLDLQGAFSLTSSAVLRRAILEASREENAEVHVLTVITPDEVLPQEKQITATNDLHVLATHEVAAFSREHPNLRINRVVTHVLHGSPAKEIAWLAARLDVDLVVVGSHGRKGLDRLLLGSVAEHVVRSAGCPVLVERSKHHDVAWTTPEIEPPCKECVAARRASHDKVWWCERHLEHHARAHTYSDGPDTMLTGVGPWGFEP